MTYSFLLVIARHGVPRQSLGVKYGVYAAYFFRGIATLALAMTRKFSRSVIHPPESLPRYARKDNKTKLASSFGGSVGKADDRGSHVILSVAKYPTTKVKSTYTRQFFGGILHYRSE